MSVFSASLVGFAVTTAVALGVFVGYRVAVVRHRSRSRDGFFEQVRDAALVTGNGAVIDANAAALEQFGYTREQFIGLPVTSLLVDPGDEKRFVKALIAGPVTDYALRLRTASGEARDFAITASARFDAAGNVIGCRGLARDVTERNRILAELHRAERDYRGLFDHAYDAILILDPSDETVLDVNQRACDLYDVPREQFIGRSMVELSVDPARGAQLVRQTRESGGRYATFQSQQRRSDGTVLDIEINAAEVVYRGRPVILSINRDISARRQAEKAIRDSEARFRLLLESVTDYAIVMLDPAGTIVSWNEGAQRIFGYTEEEVLGRSAAMFSPASVNDELQANLVAAVAYGRLELEVTRVAKHGSRFAAWVSITPMVDENRSLRGFAVVTRDITERKTLEDTRQRLVSVFRVVATEWRDTFDAVDVPIVVVQSNGHIVRLNRAAQLLARTEFRDLVNSRAADIAGEPWQTIARLADRTVREEGALSERVTDRSAVWQVSSFRAGSANDRRAIVVAYDLTLVTQLEASLREKEVAAALGTMVAAVAHEVRNPLFTISAIVDALVARYGTHEGVARYESPLRDQVARLNRLMGDLLQYGKPSPLTLFATSLADAIRAAADDCAALASHMSVAIDVDIDPDLPPAWIDSSRIEQVMQNVIDNAIRHSKPGSSVRVEVRTDDEGFACRVFDEGPGVAAEDVEHVFEPFFSRRHGGTGLGLAIARKIVIAHGGEILLRNREDRQGAVITLRLPCLRRAASLAEAS